VQDQVQPPVLETEKEKKKKKANMADLFWWVGG
jgi:hypothetical protein